MIGGNAYGGRPSKELYIRWMQANVFMPSVQFSLVPWDYDDEVRDYFIQLLLLQTIIKQFPPSQTVQICKDVLAIREQYQSLLYKAVDQALVDASPINRPMWWEDPNDVNTYIIDDRKCLPNCTD